VALTSLQLRHLAQIALDEAVLGRTLPGELRLALSGHSRVAPTRCYITKNETQFQLSMIPIAPRGVALPTVLTKTQNEPGARFHKSDSLSDQLALSPAENEMNDAVIVSVVRMATVGQAR
jgi:hypothetical protein